MSGAASARRREKAETAQPDLFAGTGEAASADGGRSSLTGPLPQTRVPIQTQALSQVPSDVPSDVPTEVLTEVQRQVPIGGGPVARAAEPGGRSEARTRAAATVPSRAPQPDPDGVCGRSCPGPAGAGGARPPEAPAAIARAAPSGDPPRLALDVPAVDGALGGGLLWGALHEAAAGPGEEGALSAFALALAARGARALRRPVLVVQQAFAKWEAGALYGPGLVALGLPPEALLLVRVPRPQDVMFVMEEGLKCAGLSVVLGEVLSPVTEALTATRRLSLAARGSDRIGLLVRHKADPAPCAALTRWRISTRPSPALDGFGGLGAPCISARLTRNRFGPLGEWPLRIEADGFRLVEEAGHERAPSDPGARAALSGPRPAPSRHRPDRTVDVA